MAYLGIDIGTSACKALVLGKDGNVWASKMARGSDKGGNAKKVADTNVTREKGWLYFVDKDGDVSKAPMARGRK